MNYVGVLCLVGTRFNAETREAVEQCHKHFNGHAEKHCHPATQGKEISARFFGGTGSPVCPRFSLSVPPLGVGEEAG